MGAADEADENPVGGVASAGGQGKLLAMGSEAFVWAKPRTRARVLTKSPAIRRHLRHSGAG